MLRDVFLMLRLAMPGDGIKQGACNICGLSETFKENFSSDSSHVEVIRILSSLQLGLCRLTSVGISDNKGRRMHGGRDGPLPGAHRRQSWEVREVDGGLGVSMKYYYIL